MPETLSTLGIRSEKNASLADYTTFRLGGPCPLLVHCETPEDLLQAVRWMIQTQQPFILIGGGSNLVVADQGIDRAVIRYHSAAPRIERLGHQVTVTGSTSLDALALYATQNGLAGLTCANGIPGTVGGAITGNAGAFGKQVTDTLLSVTVITPSGEVQERAPADLDFRYRDSALKTSGEIVVSARFALTPANSWDLMKERADTLALRWQKHPDLTTHPCAGSFFRNIEPTSKAERRQAAGWFLEQAGAKDLRVGGAFVFERHANIIVKGENGRAKDVYTLAQTMAAKVKETFGFDLVREVRFVGDVEASGKPVTDILW